MKAIGGVWYCTAKELELQCSISGELFEKGNRRKSPIWKCIKDPDDGRALLVQYDTMAEKYKNIVRIVLCDGLEPCDFYSRKKVEVLSERSLSELVEMACKEGFRRYLRLYPLIATDRASLKTQTCLARAAAIVELIGNYIVEREIGQSSYAPYKEFEAWANQDGNYEFYFPKGNQYIPRNPIRLKEKVVERFGWKPGTESKPIQEVVALPRQGNKSRESFSADAELLAWVTMARANGGNEPNQYIIRKISEVCRITGRDVPSNSWFSQLFASPKMKLLTANGRFGAGSKLASRYTHSITMARAMYAGDCWMMDATRVNFIEHQTSDKDKTQFMFVVAIRDAYSGHIIGCHFDTKEDRWGYLNALKMAYKATGYLPQVLVHDRFPGYNTDEMESVLESFRMRGVHTECTFKATSKALLERWFDTLQTVFLSKSRYYYGQGIMSTRTYAHRSAEYLLKARKEAKRDGWDFDKAWQEAWQLIEEYCQTPVSAYSKIHKGLNLSPAQLHAQSETPNVIRVDPWHEATLFWAVKKLDIRRASLSHEVHGVRYEYPIYDTKIMYRYNRVAIRYDESDPTKVMLFAVDSDDNVTDFFIDELTHVTPIVMYGKDAEKSRLAGRQEKIKKFEEQKKADLEEITNQASSDPEYLLKMAHLVPKSEAETLESALIYEHMGLVVATEAQKTAVSNRKKQPKTATVPASFDPKKFVNDSFFNQ